MKISSPAQVVLTCTFKDLHIPVMTFLELKNKILNIQDDLIHLDEFITPSTDLHMLFLLKFALSDGLNIENVDKGKFLAANTNDLNTESSNEIVSEGTQFLNISLDHILKEGNTYTYKDFFDVFGLNSQVNVALFIIELEMEIGKALNIDFETTADKNFDLTRNNMRTLEELLNHFNNNQLERQKAIRNPWWKLWT